MLSFYSHIALHVAVLNTHTHVRRAYMHYDVWQLRVRRHVPGKLCLFRKRIKIIIGECLKLAIKGKQATYAHVI